MTPPKITVITPSYNQGQFIEETIRSVLDQNYPSLEYIVMDGGSTDVTVDILKKYDHALTYWVSEKDRGQAHAINKAFERATGELIVWINSDDLLLPGSLATYAAAYERDPGKVIVGDVVYFDRNGPTQVVRQTNCTFNGLVVPWLERSRWMQPGTAVPRAVWEKAGPLDETYRFVFDREWGIRLFRIAGVTYLHQDVAMFRLHDQSKTVGEARDWFPEEWRVTEQYIGETPYAGRPEARAMLELMQANRMLSASTYDRGRAFGYARAALRGAPSVALSRTFAMFAMRAVVPRAFLTAAVAARRRMHARRRRG
jgi:glycosyltransferase involved in cell wall biosynthesis